MIGLEPEKFLVGYHEINNYLVESHFILEPKHTQNAAYSKQSIEFIQNTVKPNLDMLFWGGIVKLKMNMRILNNLVNLPKSFQRLCRYLPWKSEKLYAY